jgi:uncharacterized membrane protein
VTVEELQKELDKLDSSDRSKILYYLIELADNENVSNELSEKRIVDSIWDGYREIRSGKHRPAREVMAEITEVRGWK